MAATDVSSWENLAYRGFACPQEYLSAELLDLILVEHARILCRSFLNRFANDLDAAGSVMSLLSDWLQREAKFDDVWTPGLGRLRAALRQGREKECVQAAAQFAMDLQSRGMPGTWSVRLETGAQFRWDGFIMPIAEELAVSSDGNVADVRLRDGDSDLRFSFRRSNGGWTSGNADALPQVDLAGQAVSLLMPWALTCTTNDDLRPRLNQQMCSNEIGSALREAIDMLRQEAPDYLMWVSRVVRGIIPLASPDDLFLSGSYPDRPGMMTCSFPAPPEILCELLVHEASHQYFHILARVGDIEDGSDSNEYYSPVRGMPRPLIYILLAYHAVGNMLLYQRACLEAGSLHASHSEARAGELLDWARQLETPLRSTSGLTPLGASMWQPLADRLQSIV